MGSSPLARGPRHGPRTHDLFRGLIPARAGTTVTVSAAGSAAGAHPRSRGDHTKRYVSRSSSPGSSPLARGPPRRSPGAAALPGLIPARAGTTGSTCPGCRGSTAHPRSRGDHDRILCFVFLRRGSSPLARGPPVFLFGSGTLHGLIPARAGTTCRQCLHVRTKRAHPRSRGDHDSRGSALDVQVGSSPLARGPPRLQHHRSGGGGLIPARAGTTY